MRSRLIWFRALKPSKRACLGFLGLVLMITGSFFPFLSLWAPFFPPMESKAAIVTTVVLLWFGLILAIRYS